MPAAIRTPPLAVTAARSENAPTATAPPNPTREPAMETRRPRRKRLPTFSTPISSVIQASNAPLVNVYDSPQKPQSAIAIHAVVVSPTKTTAVPIPSTPTMYDRRRLYVSATMPVGTSQTKTVASMTVPIRISWSGDSRSTLTR